MQHERDQYMTTAQPQGGDIKTGVYRARAIDPIKGGYVEQAYGRTKNGIPELLLRMDVRELGRVLTAPLYFSAEAAPGSVSRLRACGWQGEDLSDLTGVDAKEIELDVSYRVWSQADGGDGSLKLKVQILSGGGGGYGSANPMTPREFAATVAALTGKGAGNGAPKPPF